MYLFSERGWAVLGENSKLALDIWHIDNAVEKIFKE